MLKKKAEKKKILGTTSWSKMKNVLANRASKYKHTQVFFVLFFHIFFKIDRRECHKILIVERKM